MTQDANYVRNNFDRALDEEWVEVYFQPIVRTLTGEVCEFEALSRWNDPDSGMLQPSQFVGVLEDLRLIHRLDAYVVDKACETWHNLNINDQAVVPVSVNLSRLDFELCDVFELVDKATRKHQVPHQMLHVEITETALNSNADLLVRTMERFREAGYQVWLDDFGSGYSSLNTLKNYTFDVVKIDMAFLHEFDTRPKSRVIISSIVNMAKQLGMQTLIEGVETPEQFDFIRNIGCEFAQGYLIGRPLSCEDNLARIANGEIAVARNALAAYYDRLGAINSLSATPFEFPWDTSEEERPFAEMLPLAIIEVEADEIRFLSANEGFVETLRTIGAGSMAQVAERLSDTTQSKSRIIQEALRATIESGAIESVDILENGHHCMLRARRITSQNGVDALLVSLINLSRFSSLGEDKRLQIALRYLYTVYEEANIVDLSDGTVHTIYRGDTAYPAVDENVLFVDSARSFAQTFVHPNDRERCIRYLDLTTLERRIEASDRHYLAEAFRALRSDGSYGWLVSVLVPIRVDGNDTVLVCVRQANQEVVSSMANEDEIPKSLLWDTLLDLVPAGVFWKDEQRRFLGVNKNFLHFYGFSSVNDVLGKNDEDMGWHLDIQPFMRNELTVIEQGEPVLNAHGTCLARGEIHNIVASKIPLYRNGEVVGLLGYFTDNTPGTMSARSLMLDGFSRMAETDRLTGISNRKGLITSVASYREAYEYRGAEGACIMLSIHGMHDFNQVYGRTFGNRILKVVAERLTDACGQRGVVARAGGDTFCALYQVSDAKGAERVGQRLKKAVERIHDVDGVRTSLRCVIGWSLISESTETDEIIDLAEKRMRSIDVQG